MIEIGKKAKNASIKLAALNTDIKNGALYKIAEASNVTITAKKIFD